MRFILLVATLIQLTAGFSVYKTSFISVERHQRQMCHAKMTPVASLSMSMNKDGVDFWESQKKLAASIADSVDQEEKEIRL